ncbi:MAG: hypothetical protein MZV63_04250 [Marinilabiliales bacterium]|nr:hypothetical protein [Marinilabiliales bacterium]
MDIHSWRPQEQATGEIAIPIIASTLTTLAAFFPSCSLGRYYGRVYEISAYYVNYCSYLVAFCGIGYYSCCYCNVYESKNRRWQWPELRKRRRKALYVALGMMAVGGLLLLTGKRIFPNLLILFGIIGLMHVLFLRRAEAWFQDIFLGKLERLYSRTLRFALRGRNPFWFLGGTFALLVITIMLFFSRIAKYNPVSVW